MAHGQAERQARPARTLARRLTLGALALALIAAIAALATGSSPAPGDLARVALCLLVSGLLSLALLAGTQWMLARERTERLEMRLGAPLALAALLVAANVLLLARLLFVSARDLWLLLAFSAFALAVALPLAWLVAGRVARALTGIQRGMERLAAGEYTPNAPSGAPGAEPGELAHLRELVNQAARGLRDAVEGRQVAEAHRRQVIAAIAHDLRTPLAAIQALVDALADGVVSDPAAIDQHYGTLRLEVCHLVTLVEELFELARIESGALALARAPVQLGELVAGAVETQRERAERAAVRLWWEAEGTPADILGDADQLYRVVEGTVRNALRHTPAGGSVLVRLSRLAAFGAGERMLVEVLDTGSGIAPESLPHIFEPMYRAEAARTRRHTPAQATGDGGDTDCEAGLGLAIASRLIAAHSGRMWAESPLPAEARALVARHDGMAGTEGVKVDSTAWPGTVVSFTLPCASSAVSAAPPMAAPQRGASAARATTRRPAQQD